MIKLLSRSKPLSTYQLIVISGPLPMKLPTKKISKISGTKSPGNLRSVFQKMSYNAHLPNIHALNSVTHTLRIQYEYTQKQCMDVAIEGMNIWYRGLTFQGLVISR